MKLKAWTTESLIYAALLAAALIVRLIHLGGAGLTDLEAGRALTALQISQGEMTATGDQPGYTALTAAVFALLGAGDFLARFFPALLGSLVVLIPAAFRGLLGRREALVLSLCLAFEPGLLAVSRTADGAVMAVVMLPLALAAYRAGKPALAGICSALALMAGPLVWEGWIIFGLAAWLSGVRPLARDSRSSGSPADWKPALLWMAGTLVVAGSLLLTQPANVSGVFNSLVSYVRGWIQGYTVSPLLLGLALLVYQPLALVLGLAGVVSGIRRKDAVDGFLSRWLLAALVLVLFYPGHSTTDLIWVVLPLWALAARQLVRWLNQPAAPFDRAPAWGLAILVVILGVFIWLSLAGLTSNTNWLAGVTDNLNTTRLYYARILIAIALMILTGILIGWGWSYRAAGRGFALGWLILLAFYNTGAAVHAAGLGRLPQNELWRTEPAVQDARLLDRTLEDLALNETGQRAMLDVAVAGFDQPAVRWLLRDMPAAVFEPALPRVGQPALLITPVQTSPGLNEAYRGQDFRWQTRPIWMDLSAREWLNWLLFREARSETVTLMLWARIDLFPGSAPMGKP